jgi:hypothetical protein
MQHFKESQDECRYAGQHQKKEHRVLHNHLILRMGSDQANILYGGPLIWPGLAEIFLQGLENVSNDLLFHLLLSQTLPSGKHLVQFDDMNLIQGRNGDHKTRAHYLYEFTEPENNRTLIGTEILSEHKKLPLSFTFRMNNPKNTAGMTNSRVEFQSPLR